MFKFYFHTQLSFFPHYNSYKIWEYRLPGIFLHLILQFLYPGPDSGFPEYPDRLLGRAPEVPHGVQHALGEGLPRPLEHHEEGHAEHVPITVVRGLVPLHEARNTPVPAVPVGRVFLYETREPTEAKFL